MLDPKENPVALIILDGWESPSRTDNGFLRSARTPVYDRICREFPQTALASSTSFESGHLSIGTGRRISTDHERIKRSIETGELRQNEVLKSIFSGAIGKTATVHLIGLISDLEDEASVECIFELLKVAGDLGVHRVNLHCILDGRISASFSRLYATISELGIGRIASICGRFYAMDAAGNWERTARAFTMLMHGDGTLVQDAKAAVDSAISRGISEEFVSPMIVAGIDGSEATIKNGDTVFFFNHKSDGLRQLAASIATSENHSEIEVVCLTDYDLNCDSKVVFAKEGHINALTQVTTLAGVTNCRVSEGDRFDHVTTLLDGGVTHASSRNRQFNIPSFTTRRLESHPEAGSFRIADRVRKELMVPDGLFVVNFPAVALAGKIGIPQNMIDAAQYVDTCLGGILDPLLECDGIAIITSSHGSIGYGALPMHLVANNVEAVRFRDCGSLEDVAPTLLSLIGLDPAPEMTGTDLRIT